MVLKDRRFFGLPADEETSPSEDVQIETDVTDALAQNGKVDAADVFVTVRNGEISLAGHVARPEEVSECGEIALRIRGVTAVRNLIEVWDSKD